MKNLTLTIAALIFSVAISFANGNREDNNKELSVSATKIKNGFNLSYTATAEGKAIVKFFDQEENLVHTDKIKSKQDWQKTYFFSDKMNLKSMVIEDENGIHFKKLNVKDGEMIIETTKSFQMEKVNGKVYLYVSGEKLAPVHVRITDRNHQLMHREVINQREDFVKAFDITNLKPGQVHFVVNDYDATYYHIF